MIRSNFWDSSGESFDGSVHVYGICGAEKKRYAAWHAEDKERRARMISDTDLPFGDQMPAVAVARKKYSESSFLQARSEVRQDDAREASARRVEVKEEPVAAVYGPVRVERSSLGMPGALKSIPRPAGCDTA